MNNNLAAQGQIAFQGQGSGGEVINVVTPAAAMDTGDWRNELEPDSRQRIIRKILNTLTICLPCTGQEGQEQMRQIATRFEEKIYTDASSQSDYLKRISMKVLNMETQKQKQNHPEYNGANTGQNPSDQGETAALSAYGSNLHSQNNVGSGKRLRLNEGGAHSISTIGSTRDSEHPHIPMLQGPISVKVEKDQVKRKGKMTPDVTADYVVVEREKLKLKQLELEEMALGRKEKILKRKNRMLMCLINLGEKVTPQQAVTRDKLMADLYEAEP